MKESIKNRVIKLKKLDEIISGLQWEINYKQDIVANDKESSKEVIEEFKNEIDVINKLIYELETLSDKL